MLSIELIINSIGSAVIKIW